MKIEELSKHHQFAWNILQGLDDGERITGDLLMARSGIKDKRFFYQVISDLRRHGYLVGSSKHQSALGYFEIRDDADLDSTVRSLIDPAITLMATAKSMQRTYYLQKYGELPLEFESEEV